MFLSLTLMMIMSPSELTETSGHISDRKELRSSLNDDRDDQLFRVGGRVPRAELVVVRFSI